MKKAFRCLKSRKISNAKNALLPAAWLAVSIVTVLSIGCGDNDDAPTGTGTTGGSQTTGGISIVNSGSGACPAGQQGCACYDNGTCNSGLVCSDNLCVSDTGTGGGGDTCPAGQQGCACYGNGTCNAGLVCSANQCITDTSGGGTGDGGTGGIGGESGNGGVGTSGGTGGESGIGGAENESGSGGSGCTPVEQANACNNRVCGEDPVCGVFCGSCTGEDVCVDGQCVTPCTDVECGVDSATGVDCGPCSGNLSCCDGSCIDTSSDVINCGGCGLACRETYGEYKGKCEGGLCSASIGLCIDIDNGFTDCEQYCSSIDEACVQNGCSDSAEVTFFGWRSRDNLRIRRCEDGASPETYEHSPCDTAIDFGYDALVRCCCTDTQ